jgi:predicted RNase H-like nuclease (RuvC/YqgF family)
VGAILSFVNSRKAGKREDVNSQIQAWKEISDKNESRMEKMEERLEVMARDNAKLAAHVRLLERTIARLDPAAEIPPMPELGSYSGAAGALEGG